METMKRSVLEWAIWRLENEVDDAHFNMSNWLVPVAGGGTIIYRSEEDVPHCKTAGCIAGTMFLGLTAEQRMAAVKHFYSRDFMDTSFLPMKAAADMLGISPKVRDALFVPGTTSVHESITRKTAIKLLKNILIEGTLDWPSVLSPSQRQSLRLSACDPIKIELV